MTNKLLTFAFAVLVAGCGGNSNQDMGSDDMGSGGGGGGGGGAPADMAGVVPCICPSGFTCDGSGVCTGGNVGAIPVDVKTVNVSGTITLNGAAPTTLPSCNPSPATSKATVHLVDSARGYQFDLPVPCSAATFAWSGVVFPGSYKMIVSGDSNFSSLPSQGFVANAALDVSADANNLALDVKTASVGGNVTLNGAAPTTAAACTGNDSAAKATVHLVDATDGYLFDLDVPCSSSAFAWGGVVFPGTYVVSVEGDASYSNVPASSFVANAALGVSGNVANQALDVKTVTAAGTVTLNGVMPTSTCPSSTTYTKAVVHLTDAKSGYQFDFPITCAQTDYAWSGDVFPGTYALTVDGGDGYSNLPRTPFVGNAALAVDHDVSGQAINVQTFTVGGTVTLNGSAPAQTQFCMSSPASTQATVTLTDATNGYAFSFAVPCSSTTLAWSGSVFPGNYRITVAGQPSYSTLPDSAFVAKDAQALTAAAANVALDVKTANVGGSITLNAAAPTTDPSCTNSPSSQKAVVRLTDAKHGYAFDLPVLCSSSSFAWSGQVFPGTYTVSVGGGNYSNLPDQPFLANSALVVTSDVTGQALDVKTANVGGSLTLNGAAPSTTTACNPNPTATKANVQFVDPVSGYAFAVPVACSAANFAWSGVVYPGTYRISVAGAGGYSNLPSEGFLATPRLKVQ
jgi:hypothetical protein